ncbi:hypothetical protein J3A83DRAFT_4050966, partial [Scleroderma citrinum]
LPATYAFTDSWSQGQTLQHIITNIASPPTGGLSLFNLYVTLLHTVELLAEDNQLKDLDEMTKHWWEKMGQAQ